MSNSEKAYREKLREYAHGRASWSDVRTADPYAGAIRETARQMAARDVSRTAGEAQAQLETRPRALVTSK